MKQRPVNRYVYGPWYQRLPSPAQYPQSHHLYTFEEKRDVVELIDEGWHPLDVATAWGMPVFHVTSKRTGRTSLYSTIYNNYERWTGTVAIQKWKESKANQKTPS